MLCVKFMRQNSNESLLNFDKEIENFTWQVPPAYLPVSYLLDAEWELESNELDF